MQNPIIISTTEELGRCIRRVRKEAGLSQSDAAGLCGVSIPFFNAVENGKQTAQIGKVLHVCKQLGIRITAVEPGTT